MSRPAFSQCPTDHPPLIQPHSQNEVNIIIALIDNDEFLIYQNMQARDHPPDLDKVAMKYEDLGAGI